jgi:hypothetical protein
MSRRLDHENLGVYQAALAFIPGDHLALRFSRGRGVGNARDRAVLQARDQALA